MEFHMQLRLVTMFSLVSLFFAAHISAMQEGQTACQRDKLTMQLEALNKCALCCNLCAAADLNHQGHHNDGLDCGPLCRDTAEMCCITMSKLVQNSDLAPLLMQCAEEACLKCAQK